MTRTEAEEIAHRLSHKHPERTEYRWLVRQEQDGEWVVVKVSIPPGKRADALKATGDAKLETEPAPARPGP
jgi:hypothetical protein